MARVVCIKRVGEGAAEQYEPAECGFTCNTLVQLRIHVANVHDHSVRRYPTNLTFQNWIDFDAWLSKDINKDCGLVRYVLAYTTKDKTDKTKVLAKHYKCHRSGKWTELEDRTRRMKSQGSCKMNGPCTSELIANLTTGGEIEVRYFEDHYPHSIQSSLGHIRINNVTKEKIIGLAKLGVNTPVDRHARGAAIPLSSVTVLGADRITVTGSDPGSQYTVVISADGCELPSCRICRKCDLCTHAATCTCPDYNQETICKHIHACCLQFPDMFPFRRSLTKMCAEELDCFYRSATATPGRSELEVMRVRVLSQLHSSPAMTPAEEMQYLKSVERQFKPTTPSSSYRQPVNQNVTPQLRWPRKRRRLENEFTDGGGNEDV